MSGLTNATLLRYYQNMNIKMDVKIKMKMGGHRTSSTRDILIDILHTSGKPLSVPEIIPLMKEKEAIVNKTTVYREIEKLMNHDILKEIYLGADKVRYEIDDKQHHHHIVCVSCKRVDDVPIEKDVEKHEEKISKNLQYKVLNHSLEFFGVCRTCQ